MSHRYILRRNWLGDKGVVNFIMLNPSTAGDVADDPTIRRCVGFSKRWGYSGISVTNLFGYRATNPKEIKELLQRVGGFRLAIGEENTCHLDREAKNAALIVCAWGDNQEVLPERTADVLMLLRQHADLYCIRTTKKGNPVHPCREPYTDAPILFMKQKLLT